MITVACRTVEYLPPTMQPPQTALIVRLDLGWDRKHPFTVTATFHNGGAPVEWLLSSELLAEGLLYPVGEGDVFLCVDPADPQFLLLVLETDHRAGFRMPTRFVENFLDRIATVKRVPWERVK